MQKIEDMKKFLVLIILIVAMVASSVTAQSYQVIVNKVNNTASISKKELALVFLKKRKRWENETIIVPIDQQVNANVREYFSKEIFNKNVAAIRSYWQSAIFSGIDTAPVEKMSDKEVIEFVKHHEGAIGYVSTSIAVAGVNVLTIKE